mmetsp:Transcript_12759/g.53996  ORF Transcript_12759/g.53996 Transcript_12759/m.53996 type:complete len:248 (+) Transcript_12759:1113-1856(+)
MFHFLELMYALDVDVASFNDADVMSYTPAGHLAAHFLDAGFELAYCTLFPRANNLFSFFTRDALQDVIYFALGQIDDGLVDMHSGGDMGWLLTYAAANYRKNELPCFGNEGAPPGSEGRNPGGCNYQHFFDSSRKPKFPVGNSCRPFDNGVGSEAIFLDREGIYETYSGRLNDAKRIFWIHNFPFFRRRDTGELERVWYIHFAGDSKSIQENFLRRYDIAACANSSSSTPCDCQDMSCLPCKPVSCG